MTCHCTACTALAERYGEDTALLEHYRKRLLVRGWAGRPDDIERAYAVGHAPWAKQATAICAQNRDRSV